MATARVAIIGAGSRGRLLGELISQRPRWAQVVAVAEPREEYRADFAQTHGLESSGQYRDWQEMYAADLDLDAVVVTTMDRHHTQPALAALNAGHHLLMEKPMAPTLTECESIASAAAAAATITAVCHSLRYANSSRRLKEIVASGHIGTVTTIDHLEQVVWWHQAHSFVRGAWSNEGRSSFMLLAKSCHDVDYLSYLVDRPCQAVSSFGSLTYFRPEHAPPGSADRCVDCDVEPVCAYSAIKQYVDTDRETWPASRVSLLDHSREAHLQAIAEGPFGRCVWRCDNDVVDHQVLALEYEGGITATLTMTGFTAVSGRRTRVHGTEGVAELGESAIEVQRFGEPAVEHIELLPEPGGHGGADRRVVDSWLRALHTGDRSHVVSDVAVSLDTHRIAFAAERARLERRVVELP